MSIRTCSRRSCLISSLIWPAWAAVGRVDGLGTPHNDAGTMRMGAAPNQSVPDANCRFHSVANAYVVGPALFPTIGSPNPMLTGIGLVRRLGDSLLPDPPLPTAE